MPSVILSEMKLKLDIYQNSMKYNQTSILGTNGKELSLINVTILYSRQRGNIRTIPLFP